MLVEHRQGLETCINLKTPYDRLIAVDHAVWMSAGVASNFCLSYFLLDPCWLIANWIGGLAKPGPYLGEMVGGLCLLLSLGLGTSLLFAFWRLVTRHRRVTNWVGLFCSNQPAMAAIALGLLFLGCGEAFRQLAAILAPASNPKIIAVASQHYLLANVLVRMVVPLVLLLWITRSQIKSMQRLPSYGK